MLRAAVTALLLLLVLGCSDRESNELSELNAALMLPCEEQISRLEKLLDSTESPFVKRKALYQIESCNRVLAKEWLDELMFKELGPSVVVMPICTGGSFIPVSFSQDAIHSKAEMQLQRLDTSESATDLQQIRKMLCLRYVLRCETHQALGCYANYLESGLLPKDNEFKAQLAEYCRAPYCFDVAKRTFEEVLNDLDCVEAPQKLTVFRSYLAFLLANGKRELLEKTLARFPTLFPDVDILSLDLPGNRREDISDDVAPADEAFLNRAQNMHPKSQTKPQANILKFQGL